MKRLFLLAALLAFGLPTMAAAQVDRATLTGVVTDKGGAVLPGATVTLTNLATNVVAEQPTTATGSFLFVNLIPGRYQIEAALTGFKKSCADRHARGGPARAGGRDARGRRVQRNGHACRSQSSLLNANDGTLGAVVRTTQVANLPLAIRNWDDLLALVPGVQGDRYTEQGGGTSFGRTGGINVHGARALQNNFLLDGVDNNSISENVQELTSQVSRPSVDAIQEFKVVTSPYSAEYGRSPGAAVSVSTKSGTNAIHGTAYEYYRNDALDANDFFSNRAHSPKPPNDQNQFGGNVGGPIIENKAFFFGDYEGTRITRGVTRITSVPTADQRAGIFTSPIKDPTTGLPFANNTIPANRIDPVRGVDHRARAAAQPAGREQLLPHRRSDGQPGSVHRTRRLEARRLRQRLRPLHLLQSPARHPRRLRRRRRRHGHVGLRQPDDQDQRVRRRLDARDLVDAW